MIYTKEVQQMCCVAKGANHANAPIPEEGKWVHAKEIKDIAARLSISQKTVETRKYSIFSKLQLSSSAELVKKAIRHGIIRP